MWLCLAIRYRKQKKKSWPCESSQSSEPKLHRDRSKDQAQLAWNKKNRKRNKCFPNVLWATNIQRVGFERILLTTEASKLTTRTGSFNNCRNPVKLDDKVWCTTRYAFACFLVKTQEPLLSHVRWARSPFSELNPNLFWLSHHCSEGLAKACEWSLVFPP